MIRKYAIHMLAETLKTLRLPRMAAYKGLIQHGELLFAWLKLDDLLKAQP